MLILYKIYLRSQPGRCTGLSFLSSGKYFAINNGSYLSDFDMERQSDQWSNVFVHPGPARTWVSRRILDYDKWIPSILFYSILNSLSSR